MVWSGYILPKGRPYIIHVKREVIRVHGFPALLGCPQEYIRHFSTRSLCLKYIYIKKEKEQWSIVERARSSKYLSNYEQSLVPHKVRTSFCFLAMTQY